jgi:putative DNA primase/helicase
VFVKTVAEIFGDYAVVAPMELLISSINDRHPTEIAKLMGARLVITQETQEGRRWDEAKVKQLTGSDKLTGRFMRQDFFDFTPTHKFLISGNHLPSLRNVDDAIRRRLLLVPFTVKIENPDVDMFEKLKAEWPAIQRHGIREVHGNHDPTSIVFWLAGRTWAWPDRFNGAATSLRVQIWPCCP